MYTREELIKAIESYETPYADESLFRPAFMELLRHPRSFFRDHLPGHMTGSAFIIDLTGKFVFLTHHAKLNKWFQPGGHADGDENIIAVAMREAREETGLTTLGLVNNSIFDIDIHVIPARKDFPLHDHYDVRILLTASKEENYVITEESNDLAWIPLAEVNRLTNYNQSISRMVEKAKRLF
jgi:8-oxo-dGTP pyrophosphatase MutT (NUDIX family)